jgi:hypothetical protein
MGEIEARYLLEIIAKSSLQKFCILLEEPKQEIVKHPDRKVPRLFRVLVSMVSGWDRTDR